jgi:metallo-beta-lactamase class B
MARIRLVLPSTFLTLIFLASCLAACSASTSEIITSQVLANPVAQEPSQPSTPPQKIDLDQDLSVRQIAARIFVIQHAFPWPANSLLVEMADGTLVLVDTPSTPKATQIAIQWFESRLGERRMIAINTGYRYDNLGGNAYLIEQGIPVYGSAHTVQLLAERGEALRTLTLGSLIGQQNQRFYEAYNSQEYPPPTRIFSPEIGLELEFGGQVLLAHHPGPAYTPDNLVVYFPMHKLLFGGGVVQSAERLESLNAADPAAWKDSLANLSQFDYDILVPKYGDRLDPGQLEHEISLLDRTP